MKKTFTAVIIFISIQCSYSQSITFSELNYNSDSTVNSGNWVEILNYGTTQIDISNWIIKDGNDLHSFKIPSNTVLQPGGRVVVVNDKQKFASVYPFIPFIGEMSFNFSNNSDQVRLYDNNGTIKVFMEYTDSLPWPKTADGIGRTLEIIDPLTGAGSAANWFTGCMFGSPGYPYTPCNEPIVFDEINYNSDTLLDAGDWIELRNRTNAYINLSGYTFKDSKDTNIYKFPLNYQLPPLGRVVLVHDLVRFQNRHPFVTNWLGPFNFNLSNEGELVRLYDFNGKIKFSMIYNDQSSGWPIGADGDGYTLELADATGNVNVPENWFTGCLEGSPGFAYDPDCITGIDEVEILSAIKSYSSGNGMIHVYCHESINDAQISVFDLTGIILYKSVFSGSETTINLAGLSSGIYFISVRKNASYLINKIVLP